jgi:hypothetical protein
VTVHVPGPTTVTVDPLTVQTLRVLDVYVIGNPAELVAARLNDASPSVLSAGVLNVMN